MFKAVYTMEVVETRGMSSSIIQFVQIWGEKEGVTFYVKFYSSGSWWETNYQQATFIL